jgi:uncharacterized protein
VRTETQLHEFAGALMLAVLMSSGLGLRWLDRKWVIENWLNRPLPDSRKTSWDIELPRPVLVGIGLAVLIAGSVVGCYAYYPSVHEAIDELSITKTEAFGAALAGDKQHALHWLPICDNWNRRLQVGAYIRSGELSDYHRMKARIFRDKLEILEHLIEEKDVPREKIAKQVAEASMAFARMSRAFRNEGG